MNTWLFNHSRYCCSVTHLYISISSSFLNVEFIKLPFSTFCPFHFPYLPLLLLVYPASHQQAGLGLCRASRDNPEWKRRYINKLNSFCVAMFYRCFQTSVTGHLGLYVTPASGVQSVISVVIAFLPLMQKILMSKGPHCQIANLTGGTWKHLRD